MEIKRLQEKQLKDGLKIMGAIQVKGPKWSGKTFLAKKLAKSEYYMQELGESNEQILDDTIEKNVIFLGEKPRLIDEWQICPRVWDKIRFLVDLSKGANGQYILTGSSTPTERKKIIHSGAGRIMPIKMSTLTFYELYPEETQYSLKDLFEGKIVNVSGVSKFAISDIVDYMLLGGWPKIRAENYEYNKNFYKSYIDTIIDTDTEKINHLSHSKENFEKVFYSIARNNATQISNSIIVADTSLNSRTVDKYLEILDSLEITFKLKPWSPINFRSKTKMQTKPKIYLCDPSLGLYTLGIYNKEKALKDLNTLGLYFENLVVKDLYAYAEAIGAELYFYRDKNDKEIDIIMEMGQGTWGIIEIKLRNFDFEKEDNRLGNFYKSFETKNSKEEIPKEAFRVIITAGNRCYTTKNGTFVIPYTMLRP